MPMMRGEDAIYSNQTSYVTEAEFAAGVIDQSKDFPRMWVVVLVKATLLAQS